MNMATFMRQGICHLLTQRGQLRIIILGENAHIERI